MWQGLVVFIGGGIGSLSRLYLAQAIYRIVGMKFPYGILVVNVLGCFLMGVLAVLFIERLGLSPLWRAGILIGFLGGFTTFSSFSMDTINLIESGTYFLALLYIIVSIIMCITATGLGVFFARSL